MKCSQCRDASPHKGGGDTHEVTVRPFGGGGGLHYTMVAIQLQQFQYHLKKGFLQRLWRLQGGGGLFCLGNFVFQIDRETYHTNFWGLREISHACCRYHKIFFGASVFLYPSFIFFRKECWLQRGGGRGALH